MKGLWERGHAVAFLGGCSVLLEETAKLRLPHAKLEIGPPPVTKWAAMNFFWRRRKMQHRLEAALTGFHDLDGIFMLSLSEKLLLTEFAAKKGINVLWVEHDRVGPWLRKNPWLPTLRKLSNGVTTICVSELSRRIYLELGWKAEKVVAIPNGIDLGQFSPSPSPTLSEVEGSEAKGRRGGGGRGLPRTGVERLVRGEGVRLGCVARLSPEKGVDVLIQAVSGLPEVDLTIIGKGPEEGYLRKMIEQIHMTEMLDRERIRIIPHVDDLAVFYRSIDVLVLPSRDNDPFGLVAAEAMACRTPVIVTDQCGIAGYLRDGHDAILCVADSDRALREAILRSMDESLRVRLSENGRATTERVLSLDSMIAAYAKLLGERGRR